MDFLILENRNWCWNIVFGVVRIRENKIFNENRESSISDIKIRNEFENKLKNKNIT